MQKCKVWHLEGIIDYWLATALQRKRINQIRLFDDYDCLFLLKHNPVITKGRFTRSKNILETPEFLEKQDIKIYETERGGDVTYHGPGQLIGYPIIELNRKGLESLEYKSKLCQSIIRLLKDYGIEGKERHGRKFSGVWVGDKKIAAVGYAIRKFYDRRNEKRITMHGFALYVLDDMENFKYINPCGTPGMKLTNMEEILKRKIDFRELKIKYEKHFAKVFKYETLKTA